MAAKEAERILAIDPGTTESAYVVGTKDYGIISHAKVPNAQIIDLIERGGCDVLVVECMEARTLNVTISKDGKKPPPQKVGDETYETCYWIGRFMEAAYRKNMMVHRVRRGQEQHYIVPSTRNKLPRLPEPVPKSKDAKIRAGLVMRFAKFDKKTGKGKAACKDTFYGFKTDEWMAFAVLVVYLDKQREEALKARLNA